MPVVSEEMERVRAEAVEQGDRGREARALAALAEVTLNRDADVEEANRLARLALDAADAGDREPRFDALHVLYTGAWWRGHLRDAEGYAREQLALAREAGRQDLESRAAVDLTGAYTARQEFDRAEALLARSLELADESGSIVARGYALAALGDLAVHRADYAEAERQLVAARVLFEESGLASMVGRVLYRLAVVAWYQDDLDRAERLSRESIRTLAPLEDRGTLCEAQRRLAEVLLGKGKVDEAERYAIAARDTVGPHDASSRATTRTTLARIRRAQRRYEDAEALLREAVDIFEQTEYRAFQETALGELVQLLRERGSDEEAAAFERRLEDVVADSSAARIA
jgi:ATP/maltotriose-dependent transcriptional regulator MalT